MCRYLRLHSVFRVSFLVLFLHASGTAMGSEELDLNFEGAFTKINKVFGVAGANGSVLTGLAITFCDDTPKDRPGILVSFSESKEGIKAKETLDKHRAAFGYYLTVLNKQGTRWDIIPYCTSALDGIRPQEDIRQQ